MSPMASASLRLERDGDSFRLAGGEAAGFGLVNDYLSHLGDRRYSPHTVRAYGFDLLAFGRWLTDEGIELDAVTTDVLLRFMAACRSARLEGRPGPNVVSLAGDRLDGYAATTINHRLAALTGLFGFRQLRDGGRAQRAAGARGSAAQAPLAAEAARTAAPAALVGT